MLSFLGKHLSFYPKDVFIFCIFYLNEKGLNQQVRLMKNMQKMKVLTLPLKKKRETKEE